MSGETKQFFSFLLIYICMYTSEDVTVYSWRTNHNVAVPRFTKAVDLGGFQAQRLVSIL